MTIQPVLRKTFLRLTLSLSSILLVLLSLECTAMLYESRLANGSDGWELVATRRLQVVPSGNPAINSLLRPNMEYTWEGIPVHINSHGLRDEEHDFAKKDGVYRILALGDSVAFGWEVRLEDSYAKRLEALLRTRGDRTFEVINAGVPGWDQPIELAYLQQTGIKYSPDLIIAEVTVSNDIYHTVFQTPPPSIRNWLLEHTYFWGYQEYMRWRIRRYTARPDAILQSSLGIPSSPGYPFPVDRNDPVWDEYIRTPLLRMAQESRDIGAEFLVLIVPMSDQVEPERYPVTPQEIVKKLGDEHNIHVLDLLPVYRDMYLRSRGKEVAEDGSSAALFVDSFHHPSALAHRLTAGAIYKAVQDYDLLRKMR